MAYEKETRQNRVVVNTPTERREVTHTDREYAPAAKSKDSNAAIAALVVLAVAVAGLLGLLFWTMRSNSNNADLAAQQQPTPQTVIQQPAQQAPVIVQQPAPATQPPVIVNPPAAAPAGASETASVPDDSSIQAAIDKKLHTDALFSTLDVTATVAAGKVTLLGTVKSDLLKNQVQQAVKSIKGVKSVDNQLTVSHT